MVLHKQFFSLCFIILQSVFYQKNKTQIKNFQKVVKNAPLRVICEPVCGFPPQSVQPVDRCFTTTDFDNKTLVQMSHFVLKGVLLSSFHLKDTSTLNIYPICHQAVLVLSQTNPIRKKGNHSFFYYLPLFSSSCCAWWLLSRHLCCLSCIVVFMCTSNVTSLYKIDPRSPLGVGI